MEEKSRREGHEVHSDLLASKKRRQVCPLWSVCTLRGIFPSHLQGKSSSPPRSVSCYYHRLLVSKRLLCPASRHENVVHARARANLHSRRATKQRKTRKKQEQIIRTKKRIEIRFDSTHKTYFCIYLDPFHKRDMTPIRCWVDWDIICDSSSFVDRHQTKNRLKAKPPSCRESHGRPRRFARTFPPFFLLLTLSCKRNRIGYLREGGREGGREGRIYWEYLQILRDQNIKKSWPKQQDIQ